MDIDEVVKREFPGFDYLMAPLLKCMPRDWTVNAWHNDTCPYFAHMNDDRDRWRIWCEFEDPSFREDKSCKRFTVIESIYSDDGDWVQDLEHLATENFAEVVQWAYENNKLVTGMAYVPLENSMGVDIYAPKSESAA